jgi:hypothetical protein
MPFFDRVEIDVPGRVDALVAALSEAQVAELERLGGVRKAYYRDMKQVLTDEFSSILADDDVDQQTVIDLTLMATNLMLRAITKFSLATAEIAAFGEPQGLLFPESSHRAD